MKHSIPTKLFSPKASVLFLLLIFSSACSTTPDDSATETVESTETVETNTVTEPVISAEEQMRMESEEKRKERTIYFEFDDTTVQQQYLAVLELHAKFLVESGMSVTLEGHAAIRRPILGHSKNVQVLVVARVDSDLAEVHRA